MKKELLFALECRTARAHHSSRRWVDQNRKQTGECRV